ARPERGRGPSLPRRGHGATAEGGTPVARGGGGRASRWGGYAVRDDPAGQARGLARTVRSRAAGGDPRLLQPTAFCRRVHPLEGGPGRSAFGPGEHPAPVRAFAREWQRPPE